MKKSIFLLALAAWLFSVAAAAQTRFGFRGGVQLADAGYTGSADPFIYYTILTKETNPWFTFFAGGLAERDITKNLTLSAELQVTGRGYSTTLEDTFGNTNSSKTRLWYVQVPLACNVRWNGFFAGAGPYLGVGLGGKQTRSSYDAVKNVTFDYHYKVKFGNEEQHFFRPLDVGVYAQLGYSFRNVRLILSYQLGLNNIIPKYYVDTDEHARHSSLGASVAYILGEGE